MGSLFLYPWIPTHPDRAAGPPPPKVHMLTTDSHPAKFCRQQSSSDSAKVKNQTPGTTGSFGKPRGGKAQYLRQKPAPLNEKGATPHESLAPAMRAAAGERHPPANPTKSKPLTPWAQTLFRRACRIRTADLLRRVAQVSNTLPATQVNARHAKRN